MTKDTRLGADPLSWIGADQAGAVAPPTAPAPGDATQDATAPETPATDRQRIIFSGPARGQEADMSKSSKVKLEQTMDTAQAVIHLEDLLNSLKSGLVQAETPKERLSIPVPATVDLELKISRKKDKAKCSFELSWPIDPEADAAVTISGKDD